MKPTALAHAMGLAGIMRECWRQGLFSAPGALIAGGVLRTRYPIGKWFYA